MCVFVGVCLWVCVCGGGCLCVWVCVCVCGCVGGCIKEEMFDLQMIFSRTPNNTFVQFELNCWLTFLLRKKSFQKYKPFAIYPVK